MTSNTILFQSVTSNDKPVQGLSDLVLNGITTIDSIQNTDNGKLYGTYTYSSPNYTLTLFKDSAKTQQVAVAQSNALGQTAVTQSNNSGITGNVNFVNYVSNDTNVQAICYLSQDSDLPMDNLQGLADYDPVLGFAAFHLQAFEYVKNIITSRYESLLYNPYWIQLSNVNSTGGYDLSRCLSWQGPDLKECSAEYAFYLIARKQGISSDSIFGKRADCSYKKVVGLLEKVDISFDQNFTRIPTKSRTMNTFKFGRA